MDLAGSNQSEPDYDDLVARFRAPTVAALVLMGSYARGDAGPFSDVDLVRFHTQGMDPGSAETHLIGDYYVVVSDVYPDQIEACFQKPEPASTSIAGLRAARPLWDPDGYFSSVQERAKAFTWDARMQTKADA